MTSRVDETNFLIFKFKRGIIQTVVTFSFGCKDSNLVITSGLVFLHVDDAMYPLRFAILVDSAFVMKHRRKNCAVKEKY